MLRGLLLTLALVCLSFATNAQSTNQSGDPSGSAQKTHPSPHHQSAPAVSLELQNSVDGISAAITAASNKPEAPEEKQRAEKDLQAQLDMATAAKKMFWVGIAEAAITFTGVMLVLATLIYTKQTAEAARDAVKETQKATEVTKAQISAYMKIEHAEFFMAAHTGVGYGIHPLVTIKAKNSGNSQAIAFRWKIRTIYQYDDAAGDIRGNTGFPPEQWGIAVASGETVEQRSHELPSFLNEQDVAALQKRPFTALFEIEIVYRNIFGVEFSDKSVFGGVISNPSPTISATPLRRVPVTLEDIILQTAITDQLRKAKIS